jgi:hypothetical protein
MMSSSPASTSVGAAIFDRRIVPEADVDLRLKGLERLLVREGQRVFDDPVDRAVRVRAACRPR